ncbi:MAG: DEAD/DEAH box helicase [Limnohabitans sp.]|nr:DEAD/DEAH box helicase [Limnohabitans sp.]
MGLTERLSQAALKQGFTQPTAVQVQAVPAILQGQDVLVTSATGSGKTAAYALPLLQRLAQAQAPLRPRPVRCLVLVPTRELASQVSDLWHDLARDLPLPLKVVTVFGGVSLNPQMMRLRGGADVVIATPGRLLDLVAHNALSLARLQVLALDEADRLLDEGFAAELNQILAQLPSQRHTLMFSATFAPAVQALAEKLFAASGPSRVRIAVEAAQAPPPAIAQRAIQVDAERRTALLKHLIQQEKWPRVLVFTATRYATEHVAHKLCQSGIVSTPFHGEMSQGARRDVLQAFKESRYDAVVTTDLGARGLDIANLPVVVNYDLPRSATDYVHRMGRTGRAGQSGLVLSFITAEAEAHFRLIEKRQGQRVAREQVAGFEPQAIAVEAPVGNGGIKGKRPSKKDKLRAAGLLPALKPSAH